jgi:hypothetical protein
MRRGRREGISDDQSREALALLGFVEAEFRLSGQALEWADGCSEDRSGSEKLTE